MSSYRIVIEDTMAQLNKFQVLTQVFRHALTSHPVVMRVVAWLVNRRITVKPLRVYAAVA